MTTKNKNEDKTLKSMSNMHPGEGFNWDQDARRLNNFTKDKGRGLLYYIMMTFGAAISLIALFLVIFRLMN